MREAAAGQPGGGTPSFQWALRFYLEAALADPGQVGAAQMLRLSKTRVRASQN